MKSANNPLEDQKPDVLPTIKMYQDIVDRAHKEVEHVRHFYTLAAGLIAAIFTVGISTFVFFTYKNTHEMKAEMKEEVELMKKKATQDYSILANDLKSTVESKSQNVERSVNARIDSEFDKDNIRGLVTEKAQERIDKVADNYIGQHISAKITPKISAVDKSVKALEKNVEFNAVSSAAQNDDKFAFEQLQKWTQDKSYPLREKAEQSYNLIVFSKKGTQTYLTGEYVYAGLPGVDISKLSLAELKAQYQKDILPGFRFSLLEHINGRKNISRKDKIAFFIDVLKTDKSLDVSLHAAELINKLSGQQLDVFNTKLFLDWYDKNGHSIK